MSLAGVSNGRAAGAAIRGRWTAEPGDRAGQSFSTGRGCIRRWRSSIWTT
jgi:hypothetical protein